MKNFKKIIITVTILMAVITSHAQQLVSITKTIDIPVSNKVLFDYISNLNNDVVWRAEVDSMVLIQSNQYGEGFIEYSSFGKKRTITPTYTTNETDSLIVFTTPDTVQYYLQSTRQVITLENGDARFIYTLEFDNYMTKQMSPFKIPKPITKMFYGIRMKKYLKVLDKELSE